MSSHRRKLRLPKADFLAVYCKDPLQGLLLGFNGNVFALVVLCPPQVFPSLAAARRVVLATHDTGKGHSLHLVASSTLDKYILAMVLS